jgi:hypothetical protein
MSGTPALRVALLIVLPMILSAAFLVALTIACLIPQSLIEANARSSAEALLPFGGYPGAFQVESKSFQLDYFTDSLMLNVAYEVDEQRPLRSALVSSQTISAFDGTTLLMLGRLATDRDIQHLSYARYWHGYLVYLRPLMIWLDHSRILVLLGLVLAGTLLFLLRALYKADRAVAMAIAMALALTNVAVVVQSLQFIQVYLIAVGVALWMVRRQARSMFSHSVPFLIAGGLTSFFDLLTAPLLTWGLPLLVVLNMLHRERQLNGFRQGISLIGRSGVAWGFAYAVCWACKWVLASLILGQNVLADALQQVAFRAGAEATNVSEMIDAAAGFSVPVRISAPLLNVAVLLEFDNPSRLFPLLSFCAVWAAVAVALLGTFRNRRVDGWFIGLLLIVAVSPYVWYAVTAQHAARHYWFTYRSQAITVAALCCAWLHAVDWSESTRWFKRKLTRLSHERSFRRRKRGMLGTRLSTGRSARSVKAVR